jgi:hypothetical protein
VPRLHEKWGPGHEADQAAAGATCRFHEAVGAGLVAPGEAMVEVEDGHAVGCVALDGRCAAATAIGDGAAA